MTDHSPAEAPRAAGLRERKQRALRARVEQVAVNLVYERGFDEVSVDEICAACEISQRTFFNHFGTKENAVIGNVFLQLDAERLQRGLAGDDDPLEVIFALVASADRTFAESGALRERRIAILQRNRELFASVTARMEAFRREFIELISARLARDRGLSADDETVRLDADLEFSLVISLAKHVMHIRLQGDLDGEQQIVAALRSARVRAARLLGEARLPFADE